MSYDWKKHEKQLYLPKATPEIVTIPAQKFFMTKGQGNPNGEEFGQRVGVLYSLAYTVKMMPRQGFTLEGYFEYSVYPLEGVWDLTEEGRKSDALNKDELVYTIMIRQPDFVTDSVADRAIETVNKKKPHPYLKDIAFGTMEDGLCVQMLHTGPYDDEPRSFNMMKEFIAGKNIERASMLHREIYISDARKTVPDKMRTVLRYKVKSD